MPRRAALLAALALLSGCAGGGGGGVAWDGRRGYGGSGDYGYELNPARAEAGGYRAGAMASRYAVPGPPQDPWGPHIREAAARFAVPESWIRAIMRQESGGRLYGGDGLPITSPVGAMGLMQVMPRTYETLRARHGLGPDPYEPRDNILAGAAYIRAMHDRFGSPGFVAAYNAGPDRVEGVLSGAMILPDETIGYLARVTPNLGTPVPAGGPWAEFAGGGAGGGGGGGAGYGVYAGGGSAGGAYGGGGAVMAVSDDPSRRAFEGGGLVTPYAPTGLPSGLPIGTRF